MPELKETKNQVTYAIFDLADEDGLIAYKEKIIEMK
jgi:hypothetical protein